MTYMGDYRGEGYTPLDLDDPDEVFTYAREEHDREVDEFIERVYDEGAHNMGGDA
jgi:hypothetical protein